ncbi:MAG: ADP-dependent glucokinase/phosphofructokinase [bacterium]
MSIASWNALYQNAHFAGLEKIKTLPGVACAFHSVIDGFIRLTPATLAAVLGRDPALRQAARAGCLGDVPLEIHTPGDLIAGLFHSLHRGSASQRVIRSEAVHRWIQDNLGPIEYRLGGTSGNMARSLAPLGIPVTVYANPLTVELAELFGDSDHLRVIVPAEGGYALQSPRRAARERGIFAVHWILEYGADFAMDLDGLRIRPGRANRFIPSWNPRNNQFRMDPVFAEGFLALGGDYSHLLFSGFHILSERYPDGSTCDDVIRPLGDFLDTVRARHPRLKIHLELASIASPAIRRAVLDCILPRVHSVGLNETELPLYLDVLEGVDRSRKLRRKSPAAEFLHAMAAFLDTAPVERIHFHNLGYYLSLERAPWHSPESSRDALLFAALMAAARARDGLFSSPDNIAHGWKAPVSDRGLQELRALAERLRQPNLFESGIGTYRSFFCHAVPTRLVEHPLFTVGLGDTISAGAVLTA